MKGIRVRSSVLALLAVLGGLVDAAAANAYIYVADFTSIARASNDGTGLNESFIPVSGFACGVAVDAQHVYYSNRSDIGRASIDGTNVNPTFIDLPVSSSPCGVAVNSTHLYWTDQLGTVGRANLNGSGIDVDFVSAGTPLCGTAIDAEYVYYTRTSTGGISRASLSTGTAEPVSISSTANCAVAVDASNVYWGDLAAGTTIASVPKLGGPPVDPLFMSTPNPSSIVSFGGNLYWTNYGGSVSRGPADGSSFATPNFIVGLGEPVGIAIDSLPQPGPPGAPPPSPSASANFSLGKPRLNRKKGTATVAATTTAAGVLTLSGNSVKPDRDSVSGPETVTLSIRAASRAKKKLRKAGKTKVSFEVDFVPTSGTPSSDDGKLKLVKKS